MATVTSDITGINPKDTVPPKIEGTEPEKKIENVFKNIISETTVVVEGKPLTDDHEVSHIDSKKTDDASDSSSSTGSKDEASSKKKIDLSAKPVITEHKETTKPEFEIAQKPSILKRVDWVKIIIIVVEVAAVPITGFAILVATGVLPTQILGGVISASVIAGGAGCVVIVGGVVLIIKYRLDRQPTPLRKVAPYIPKQDEFS